MPSVKILRTVRNHFSEQHAMQHLASPNVASFVCYVMDDQGHEKLVTEYMIQQSCLKLLQQCRRFSQR